MNVTEIIQHGQENKLKKEVYDVPYLEVGEFVAQGDINLIRIPDLPQGVYLDKNPQKQLVEGNSKGARHCLNSLDKVKIYHLDNPNPLQICIIEFLSGETILTHPEHKHLRFTQPCFVLVTHQRSYADDLKAIAD